MLLRLLSLVAVAVASITDCDPSSLFRPTKLALTPDPPVRGKPVLMTVELNNPGAPVMDGTVTTSVNLNGIPFSPSTGHLCENTQCPIVTGWNDRSTTSTWPDTVSGKVVSKSQWHSATGKSLLCVQTSVKVAAAAPKRLRHFHYDGFVSFPVWDAGNSTATDSGSGSGSGTGSSSKSGGSGSGSNSGNSTSSGSSTASGRRCVNCLIAK